MTEHRNRAPWYREKTQPSTADMADDPLAGQVLRILAWYAPEAISRALLDGLADPPALLRAVGRLAAYSMLTADAGTLAMHRLVQAVTRIIGNPRVP